MLRKFQREPLKPITSLRFVRLPSAWRCHGWDSSRWPPATKDVGNLIFGSSAFSKSSLNIWKLNTVHVLSKPSLVKFEHYFASVWDECNYAVVWTFFGIAFLWDWNEKTDIFQSSYLILPFLFHITLKIFYISFHSHWNANHPKNLWALQVENKTKHTPFDLINCVNFMSISSLRFVMLSSAFMIDSLKKDTGISAW